MQRKYMHRQPFWSNIRSYRRWGHLHCHWLVSVSGLMRFACACDGAHAVCMSMLDRKELECDLSSTILQENAHHHPKPEFLFLQEYILMLIWQEGTFKYQRACPEGHPLATIKSTSLSHDSEPSNPRSPQHQCAHSLSDALNLFSQRKMNKAMSEHSMHCSR